MASEYRIFSGRRYHLADLVEGHAKATAAKKCLMQMGGSVRLIAMKRDGRPVYALYVRWDED